MDGVVAELRAGPGGAGDLRRPAGRRGPGLVGRAVRRAGPGARRGCPRPPGARPAVLPRRGRVGGSPHRAAGPARVPAGARGARGAPGHALVRGRAGAARAGGSGRWRSSTPAPPAATPRRATTSAGGSAPRPATCSGWTASGRRATTSRACPSRCGRAPATWPRRTRGWTQRWPRCAAGDLAGLGELIDASHASLRDLYEVSVPAVERTVEAARAAGAAGARIHGGGFGGGVLALFGPGARPPEGSLVVSPGGGARLL